MKRLVIYYLERYGGLPCASDYAKRQLSWAQGGTFVSSSAELVKTLKEASGEAALWDEIILMSDLLIGPIGEERLEVMLSAMEKADCEAWGIAGARIKSLFIALRKELFSVGEFTDFIDGLGENPLEKIAAWIVTSRWRCAWWAENNADHIPQEKITYLPYTAVTQYGIPFVSIDCLLQPHSKMLDVSMGEETVRLFRLLEETVDMDWVWERLLAHPLDYNLIENLGMVECMETGSIAQAPRDNKACLLMHLYYQDLGPEALCYAANVPDDVDIYITTSSEEKKQFFTQLFSQRPNRVEVRVVKNRGRDMAGLLVGLRDVAAKYDVCCFYHDKKSPSNASASVGRSFAYMISESALASRGYVERILQKFHDEPRLGLLVPMVPHHGDYYMVATHFWDHNYPYVIRLLEQLKITAPVQEDRCVPAAWGSVFWFRTKALQPLLSYAWAYEDFPEEPYPIDGSIAHAIERSHCLIAQSQGYYTKLVAPTYLMTLHTMNFFQYWQDYANEMVRGQVIGPHNEVVRYCGKCLTSAEIRAKQKIQQWLLKWTKKRKKAE